MNHFICVGRDPELVRKIEEKIEQKGYKSRSTNSCGCATGFLLREEDFSYSYWNNSSMYVSEEPINRVYSAKDMTKRDWEAIAGKKLPLRLTLKELIGIAEQVKGREIEVFG